MTQKKSQRLATLNKLVGWKERDAAAAVGQQQARLQAEQQQLKDLRHYYRDYMQVIDQQKTLSRSELLNYRGFCQQLAKTIRQGEQRVANLEVELERKKEVWFVCRNKRLVLDEMTVRSVQQEHQQIELQEQKEAADIWQIQRHLNNPSP